MIMLTYISPWPLLILSSSKDEAAIQIFLLDGRVKPGHGEWVIFPAYSALL